MQSTFHSNSSLKPRRRRLDAKRLMYKGLEEARAEEARRQTLVCPEIWENILLSDRNRLRFLVDTSLKVVFCLSLECMCQLQDPAFGKRRGEDLKPYRKPYRRAPTGDRNSRNASQVSCNRINIR
jgi:hypothetical protein